MDSNHDKQLQRLLCYHYTTGQHLKYVLKYYTKTAIFSTLLFYLRPLVF